MRKLFRKRSFVLFLATVILLTSIPVEQVRAEGNNETEVVDETPETPDTPDADEPVVVSEEEGDGDGTPEEKVCVDGCTLTAGHDGDCVTAPTEGNGEGSEGDDGDKTPEACTATEGCTLFSYSCLCDIRRVS